MFQSSTKLPTVFLILVLIVLPFLSGGCGSSSGGETDTETPAQNVTPDSKEQQETLSPPTPGTPPGQPTQTTVEASPPSPLPVEIPVRDDPVPNTILLTFSSTTTSEERQAYLARIDGASVQEIAGLDVVVVHLHGGMTADTLPESPVVVGGEPDYYAVALQTSPVNDPLYPDQWALPVIGAPDAWAQIPLDTPMIPVAVIDSGVCLEHPDLAGRLLPGFDFIENDTVPQDAFGHGCGVAGIIAANGNNALGIAGVAPNTQIMPLRVLDANGIGTYSNVAAAIVWATDHGAQIINLSLGGTNPSSVLENAVNYAASRGVILIAAAGNTGQPVVLYPAAYPAAVAVGSIDVTLQRSSFSAYGPVVAIFAPGRDILTTHPNGGYTTMSGTSFAAPYVAGSAAVKKALGGTLALNGDRVYIGGGLPDDSAEPTPDDRPTPETTPTDAPQIALVMRNPAAVYCLDLGYDYQTVTGQDGGEFGVCIFPNGEQCEQWEFLAGQCGQAFSYCAQQGYGIVTMTDGQDPFSPEYGVCVDDTGTVVGTVTTLSALSARAGGCYEGGCAQSDTLPKMYMADLPPSDEEASGLTLPSSFNWRTYESANWFSSIKNQASCGSCWSFSAGGVLEAAHNISSGNPNLNLNMSEQHLVSSCYTAYTCNSGGWAPNALFYIRDNGIPDEPCDPYQSKDSTCRTTCLDNGAPVSTRLIHIDSTYQIWSPTTTQLKENLISRGPLDVAIGIGSEFGGYWDGEIYRCSYDSANGNTDINHAVVLAGYNDAGGYWIIRNSWGTGWPYTAFNDGGYFKMGYGECNMGRIHYAYVYNTPVAPTQTLPGNGANVNKQVTMTWQSTVPTRSGYDFRLSQSANPGTSPWMVNTTLAATTTAYNYTFTNAGTYYWHVRVKTANGSSAWATRSFVVETSLCGMVSEIPTTECQTLESLFNNTGGAGWTTRTGWMETTTPCSWHGVTCDAGHVSQLILQSNNLAGTLPNLSALTGLQILDMGYNAISGSIPASVSNLTVLQILNLYDNQLTGGIPTLSLLVNLRDLNLARNGLTGSIPALSTLTSLQELNLSQNVLTGSIPSLSANTHLQVIDLSFNQLTGNIPDLSTLTNLRILGLDFNQLTGSVPSFSGLTQLEWAYLGTNALTGGIADFSSLPNLTIYAVNNNQLTGAIPNMTGAPNLEHVNLGDNQFSGEITGALFPTQITELYLGNNQLTGAIPDFSAIPALSILDLSSNQFNGELPVTLSSLPMSTLRMGNNLLSGAIPTWIGDLTTLIDLSLGHNLFFGSIPPEIGSLTGLFNLELNNNQLTGDVPSAFMNLIGLQTLDISHNCLTSSNPLVTLFLNLKDPDWAATQCAVPFNDAFSGAVNIGDTFPYTYTQNIYGSSVDGNDPAMCVPDYANTVWFKYVAQENSYMTLDTIGSAYDTVMAVYTGTEGSLTQIACNDDSGGNFTSEVGFSALNGTTYYIMAAKYGSYPVTGSTTLVLNAYSDTSAPVAYFITPTAATGISTDTVELRIWASNDTTDYTFFRAQYDDEITGTGLTATGTKPVPPPPPPPDSAQQDSELTAQVVGWYDIGYGVYQGDGIWTIEWDTSTTGDQWIDLVAYACKLSMLCGTPQENHIPLDRTPPTGSVTSPTGGTEYGPVVSLTTDASDNLSGIDRVVYYAQSPLPWSNNTWVQVGTVTQAPYAYDWDISGLGEGTVTVTVNVIDRVGHESNPALDDPAAQTTFDIDSPPSNDLFQNAEVISLPLPYTWTQDIEGATATFDPQPTCVGDISSAVWLEVTPDINQLISLDTTGSAYDTVLAVYTGMGGTPAEVSCNDDMDEGITQSSLWLYGEAGTTYHILVAQVGNTPVTDPTSMTLAATTVAYYPQSAADLIESIHQANANGQYDEIVLMAGTYTLTEAVGDNTGLPPITSAITISGYGQTLTRDVSAPAFRLLQVDSGGDLTLLGITLSNGDAAGGDGGAILNNGVLTLHDSTLEGNHGYYGGAITNWNTASLYNTNVFNNTAEHGGGGLDNPGALLTLYGGAVSGNTAPWGGGIISWGTTDISHKTLISNNTASEDGGGGGGGIRNYGTLTLDDVLVNNNDAIWGGGLSNYQGTVAAIATQFLYNSAHYGGGLHNNIPALAAEQTGGLPDSGPDGRGHLGDGAPPPDAQQYTEREARVSAAAANSITLTLVALNDNIARYGGGLYNHSGQVTLDRVTTVDNFAEYDGGGVYNAPYGALSATTIHVLGNNAIFNGGGLANWGTAALADLNIQNNQAQVYNGGGIFHYGTTLTLDGGNVFGNEAGGHGGGVYALRDTTITGVNFGQNSAYYNGGAILTAYEIMSIDGSSVFYENHAGSNGGAIDLYNGSLTLNNTTFIENTAIEEGGAVHYYTTSPDQTLTVTNSTFTGNTADHGGAILIYNDAGTGAELTITGSIFRNNTGLRDGGALFANAALSVQGSCIMANSNTAFVNNYGGTLNATGNWWGLPEGPTAPGGYRLGDSVSVGVDTSGFMTAPILGCDTLPTTDLGVTKNAAQETVVATHDLTYLITVTNHSLLDAHNVTVTDTLPVNTTLVRTTGAPCVTTDSVVTCALDTIPAGTHKTLSFVVNVGESAEGTLENTVEARADEPDTTTYNNQDSATTTVIPLSRATINEQELFEQMQTVIETNPAIQTITLAIPDIAPGHLTITLQTADGTVSQALVTVTHIESSLVMFHVVKVTINNIDAPAAYAATVQEELVLLLLESLNALVTQKTGLDGALDSMTLTDNLIEALFWR